MERLLSKLQAQARAHPTNSLLQRTLSDLHHLLNGAQPQTAETKAGYEELQRNLEVLATQGLWMPEEEEISLHGLRQKLGLSSKDPPNDGRVHSSKSDHSPSLSFGDSRVSGDSSQKPQGISIVQPPPLSMPLLSFSSLTPTVLPIELVHTLNHTFFLHLLATDPGRVLPPGKSLLSMMTTPRTSPQPRDGEIPKLEGHVKEIIHGAFWREALESLSNPSPAIQLARLGRLYEDLLAALKPLLPRNHSVLLALSLPLSPTSAPLRSAIIHLREALVALRQRCSPARDAYIDNLLSIVSEPSQLASSEELAKLVIDTARAILELSEIMKEDLSQFVLGSMDEQDLKGIINQQAMLGEKTLILQLWSPSQIEPAWKGWLDGFDATAFPGADTVQPSHRRWTYRLTQSLGVNSPVNCPLPTRLVPGEDLPEVLEDEIPELHTKPNALPPPFFVTCPTLLAAQNYLQALVITASLRSLVRLPFHAAVSGTSPSLSSSSSSAGDDNPSSFTQRIWTLLKASIDEEPGADDTRIVNLADEVVRVRRTCADPEHPCGPEEEARLRAAVDRTLQPRDLVFLLLQKRLLQALAAWLVSAPERVDGNPVTPTVAAPLHMQTGKERADLGRRPRLRSTLENSKSVFIGWERERDKLPAVKGFEDEVLMHALEETFGKIGIVVDWTVRIWQDLIESGEIGGLQNEAARSGTDT